MTILKDLHPLTPSAFFQVKAKIYRSMNKQNILPDITPLYLEHAIVDMALSWSLEGIKIHVKTHKKLEEEERLELFFDTRDVKSVSSITRFCHHFTTFEKPDGMLAMKEVTRFRGNDSHKLADPSLFFIDTVAQHDAYEIKIEICKEALYGYNPTECKRLGFAYQLIRDTDLSSQHFPVSSLDFFIEKHPELWSSLELEE